MKKCTLFLNGRYDRKHLEFYRQFCKRRFLVAVDGGFKFFQKTGLRANLLIGDMDSIRMPANVSDLVGEVLTYPIEKDQTDAELALDYCLDRGAVDIDMVMPAVGEIDHFLGNISLLFDGRFRRQGTDDVRVRIVNHHYEMIWLEDSDAKLTGKAGDVLSILPISSKIGLDCKGTEYDVTGIEIMRGQTRGLRNRLRSKRVSVRVSGTALVIHHWS